WKRPLFGVLPSRDRSGSGLIADRSLTVAARINGTTSLIGRDLHIIVVRGGPFGVRGRILELHGPLLRFGIALLPDLTANERRLALLFHRELSGIPDIGRPVKVRRDIDPRAGLPRHDSHLAARRGCTFVRLAVQN